MVVIENISFNSIHFVIATIILTILLIILLKKNKSDYYREIPNLSSAVINYYSKGKITDKVIYLTLLDLIAKGYYRLEKRDKYYLRWKKDKLLDLTNLNLTNCEKIIVRFINGIMSEEGVFEMDTKTLRDLIHTRVNLSNTINSFNDELKDEIQTSYGFIHKEKNYIRAIMISLIYFIFVFNSFDLITIIFGIGYSLLVLVIANGFKNITFDIKGIIGIVTLILALFLICFPIIPTLVVAKSLTLILILFNPVVFLLNVIILSKIIPTPKQTKIINEVNGLKEFLEDFSNLEDREIDYINFFNKYYVVSEALDVKLTDNPYLKNVSNDITFDGLPPLELTEYLFELFM